MVKKRSLARGLDELLAQHDQDLPFLDAYGPVISTEDELIAQNTDGSGDQLLEVILRLLRSKGEKVSIEDGLQIGDFFSAKKSEIGVKLIVQSKHSSLPLVPSDLNAPGFEYGELSKDRNTVKLTIVQWGIPARRFIERLCEHRSLEDDSSQ
ncbi:MAG: hypothetical protein QF440_01715 [Candidatus Thalassarchaeaceae archaeon]|jgi:hypothetical protein|nr:hypothetical protein [Candidatus Thalassarchaeaceae archaeon]